MERQPVSDHRASMWCVATTLKAALAGKTLPFFHPGQDLSAEYYHMAEYFGFTVCTI